MVGYPIAEYPDGVETGPDLFSFPLRARTVRKSELGHSWPEPGTINTPVLVRSIAQVHPEAEVQLCDEPPRSQMPGIATEIFFRIFHHIRFSAFEKLWIGVEPALDLVEPQGPSSENLQRGSIHLVPEGDFKDVQRWENCGAQSNVPYVTRYGVRAVPIGVEAICSESLH